MDIAEDVVIEKTPELNLTQPRVEIQARETGACCVKGNERCSAWMDNNLNKLTWPYVMKFHYTSLRFCLKKSTTPHGIKKSMFNKT